MTEKKKLFTITEDQAKTYGSILGMEPLTRFIDTLAKLKTFFYTMTGLMVAEAIGISCFIAFISFHTGLLDITMNDWVWVFVMTALIINTATYAYYFMQQQYLDKGGDFNTVQGIGFWVVVILQGILNVFHLVYFIWTIWDMVNLWGSAPLDTNTTKGLQITLTIFSAAGFVVVIGKMVSLFLMFREIASFGKIQVDTKRIMMAKQIQGDVSTKAAMLYIHKNIGMETASKWTGRGQVKVDFNDDYITSNKKTGSEYSDEGGDNTTYL